MAKDSEVAIVGAGAAGLAAARTLIDAGLSVHVLEAKNRIGGRAYTESESVGIAWDHGAHWLHDQGRNFFATLASAHNIPLKTVSENRWLWTGQGWASDFEKRDYDAYCDLVFDRIQRLGLDPQDKPVSDAQPPHFRFRSMFNSWYAALSGMEPDESSVHDDYRYSEDTGNARVCCGYGQLLAKYASGVPVTLSTPVRAIDWSANGVALETSEGTVKASAAIVTVSNNVLVSDAIRFSPSIPAPYREAFENIPLGGAEKIAIAFDKDVLGLSDAHLFFYHSTPKIARFQIRPFGENIAIAFVAGRFAREIANEGTDAMASFALSQLVDVFGADIRKSVTGVRPTNWCVDPYIGGGYSTARPGYADMRCILSEPIAERLYFAGEAHALDAFGTVHGAYRSGVATAKRIAGQLHPELIGSL